MKPLLQKLNPKRFSGLTWAWIIAISSTLALSLYLALTHSPAAIISFDEGFRGSAGILFSEKIRSLFMDNFLGNQSGALFREGFNGVMMYTPTWTVVAGVLGAIFGPTVEVFRATTLLFYAAGILLTFWFIIKVDNRRFGALIPAALLATSPLYLIYSHLIILEVPLLVGSGAIIMLLYLYAMGLLPRTWKWIVVISLVCMAGTLTKLIAVGVIWATLGFFAVSSLILFPRHQLWKKYLKWEFILFAACSFAALAAFSYLQQWRFDFNIVTFHTKQTEGITGEHGAASFVHTVWNNREFYLRDFRNMPFLSWILWMAPVALLIIRRSPLSWLLVSWVFATYFLFSGVTPQVPQYLMPIYLPMALASGLLVLTVADYLKGWPLKHIAAGVLSLFLITTQVQAVQKSETHGWRDGETGQRQASAYLAEHLGPGDRVLTWHDGNTFLIREAGQGRELHILNGNNDPICQDAMVQNTEWAMSVYQPPYVKERDLAILNAAPWEVAGRFGPSESTIIYRNTAPKWPFTIEGETYSPTTAKNDPSAKGGQYITVKHTTTEPEIWGCYRQLPLGTLTADFILRLASTPADAQDSDVVAKIEFSSYPAGERSERNVTLGELKAQNGFAPYTLKVQRKRLNLPGEFRMFVYGDYVLDFDAITVSK
ncbi:MAG TPA: hypothetical protein VLA04_04595 [Verrucomicrobiae bacterium]|nr:hypothetical protein [Verrucomicrobiae bacterium]